jgi:hypothetical protein
MQVLLSIVAHHLSQTSKGDFRKMKILRPWLLLLGAVVFVLSALVFSSAGASNAAAPSRFAVLAPGSQGVSAPADVANVPAPTGPVASQSIKNDVSAPLSSVRPFVIKPGAVDWDLNQVMPLPGRDKQINAVQANFTDPVLQQGPVANNMPAPIVNFDGVTNVNGVLPPDTNGDVGPNHYMQWVNLSFAIYNKTGALLYGPAAGNTLWAGFGGLCETTNSGDPIVQYDHLADRWMVSQFAFSSTAGPYHQCIAVSQTPDPTGAWYRYDFLVSTTKLNDYPHFGVWPDGYYMSINQFTGGVTWGGAGAIAFERAKMLAGLPAQMVYFDLFGVDPNLGGMLPSDLDGPAPAAGTPNYFAEADDAASGFPQDQLQIWQFHVDWATPANSTFTLNTVLPTAAFDSNMCNGSRNCIRQPSTTRRLDAIADRLMYRLAYRNFGTYQSIVANHTVDVNSRDRAGIRWYELRNTGAGWTIRQQGTFAAGTTLARWMGSIAMDSKGDIALGYTKSGASSPNFPSPAYVGRLVTDALGTLPQGETTLFAGTGSQTHSASRWGDYSMMAVDPDGCTFWYTSEYVATTGSAPWRTRIGSFKFPSCP